MWGKSQQELDKMFIADDYELVKNDHRQEYKLGIKIKAVVIGLIIVAILTSINYYLSIKF